MLVTVGIVVTLAACSSTTQGDAAPKCSPTASGSISDAVKATGKFGTLPIVVFDSPTAAKKTQRTVAIKGDGDVVADGDTVNVQYSIFNGATGVNIAGTDYTDATLSAFPLNGNLLSGFVKTLECSTVGSRVVGVIPPSDAFGAAGSPDLGIKPGEDVVFVADIISIAKATPTPDPSSTPAVPALPKADGADQPPTPGFPTVVLADNGRPTVTIPDEAPPTELKIAVLKKGDGEVVPPASDVIVHYEGINWNTKEIFDESWKRGSPSPFNTSQVIAGFTKAIEGQTVGSQVMVIIPPAEGYGPAGRPPSIGGTDTLVFVVDILGLG